MQTVRERNYQKPAILNGRIKKNGVAPHGIRWTVDEYDKMYEQGLFHGKRVELLTLVVIDDSSKNGHYGGARMAKWCGKFSRN